ncbi:MAG: Autoinducer 2 sensor kinase/phosphatase LuxQ [Planctomycetota bacterium]|jgi:signal transduction histidine kinase/CheY-like chemotaxis protein
MHDLIDQLFPFQVTVGAGGDIVSLGRSLRRVIPHAQGRSFLEVFEGVRPPLKAVADLDRAVGDVVLLHVLGTALQLRGQFVRPGDGTITFVGSPRVVGLSSIESWPVGIQDYAPHDASADYAMVLEAMSLQLKDLESMVGRLQDAERIERSLRERAEAANLAKSNFLANISHEIRTPMTAVLGYAELLRDPDLGAEERADAVETIVRNGNHLMRILNDLLDLSKIEAGRMDIDRREFSLVRLLRDVRDLMEVNASSRGNSLALRLDVQAAHDQVIGDATRIRQVLLNLVGNAVKFTKGGSITIEAATEPRGERIALRVAVTDTGKGIPADQMGRLFEPFSQLDREFVREHGGTGLGLAISSRIANLLGGRIDVASTPGIGSTFTLHTVLDAAHRTAAGGQPAAEPGDQPLAGVHVLLVEDSIDSARLLSTMMGRAGATVEVRGDGLSAVEAVDAQHAPDVILMDLQLPGIDGIEATRRIRAKGCRSRIVALTAAALGADREQARAAGCDGFALKPISRADLVQACRGEPQRGRLGQLRDQ